MNDPRVRPVLVGVDGSDASAVALRVAVAEAHRRGAPLQAVHAWLVTDPGLQLEGTARLDTATEELLVKALHEHLAADLGERRHGHAEERVIYGYAGRVLSQLSADVDLVVVGSHGLGGLRGALFGSVSQYVLEHATSPVMVTHSEPRPTRRVVVGVDGSAASLAALRWADSYAADRGLPLLAVHAGEPAPAAFLLPVLSTAPPGEWTVTATERLADWLGTLAPDRAGAAQQQVDHRPPTVALLDRADAETLLVVGRRGTGGIKGLLLGSVARRLAAQAAGIVVVVGEDI